MTLFGDMSPLVRRSVLAVSMLVVLLILTGAAWLISRSRAAARPGEQWYIVRDGNGLPVAWRVAARLEDKNGSTGYDVVGHPGPAGEPSFLQWSRWRLSPDHTKGVYFSLIELRDLAGPGGQPVFQKTTIEYGGGRAVVSRGAVVFAPDPTPVGHPPISKPLPVDENYLPEGTLWPAIAQVARSGKPATHTMVQDETMSLMNLSMQPLDERTITLLGAALPVTPVGVIRSDTRSNAQGEEVFFVAADGSIAGGEIAGKVVVQSFLRTDYKTLVQHFPAAPGDRTRALRQQDLP